jgi:PST family polysaccharide transporter
VSFRLKGLGGKLFKSRIAHNAASLYLVQACRKLLPLFTLPYLARVLGPSGWGDVAFTQSMGDFIGIFIEFGFLLSATRDLAQNRNSKEASGRIAVGTFGAQAALASLAVVIALAVSTQVPLLSSHPKLLSAGIIYGVAGGLSPIWLFQGLERMALVASLEVSSKVAALGAILLFVHSPSDEWKVLAFQSAAPVVTMLVGFWMAHRLLTLYLPSLAMVWRALRMGWPMFLLRSGATTYSTGNVIILALFAPASIVGYFASAEKLAKAMTGLLMPIRDAFYPRLSQLAAHSHGENQRLTRISALIEVGCGLILSIAAFAGAHVIVRIVFGRTFEPAVALLQILALHPFITSLADAIGFQSLLPAGKEAIVTKAIVVGGLVNLASAFVLAPRFLGKGMAVSVVLAEAAVCGILVYIVARTTKLFRRGTGAEADFDGFPLAPLDVPRRINE